MQELERLQMIVNDRRCLARQLNQLMVREWRQQQQTAYSSKENSLLATLLTTREMENCIVEQQKVVDMETIVAASTQRSVITKSANGGSTSLGNLTLEHQVSLEYFRVLQYVPSSSLVRAEVVLNNLSDTAVADSFVMLTAPQGTYVVYSRVGVLVRGGSRISFCCGCRARESSVSVGISV